MEVAELRSESALLIRRWNDSDSGLGEALMMFNFGKSAVSLAAPLPEGQWQKRFDSAHARWQGSGSAVPESLHSEGVAIIPVEPKAFVVFTRF